MRPNGVPLSTPSQSTGDCRPILKSHAAPSFAHISTESFDAYKHGELAAVKSPSQMLVALNAHPESKCTTYANAVCNGKPVECVAVMHSSNLPATSNLLRYNSDSKKTGRVLDPVHPKASGYFRNVAKTKGRKSQADKTKPLLQHLDSIDLKLRGMLSARGIHSGDDIVLMVANDGEIDLFLNFACSCRAHNISLHNVVVVAGSSEIVSVVRATGAVGFYHENFATVERRASSGYLDKIFVEMMWYKAFSLWLTLRAGYHVLFQDLDLVWFRNPFEYFHGHRNATGGRFSSYLSDDGQRSLRYSPFYANSGFYYLRSTPSNINFAYGVMTSFDILQATGSHQNVFTMRLMENMDLLPSHRLFLNLLDFPSGVKYHHDKNYMRRVMEKKAHPYIFHMCWTANKKQKLENFALVKMWYVSSTCSLKALVPSNGDVYKKIVKRIGLGDGSDIGQHMQKTTREQSAKMFDALSGECCVFEGQL